MDSERVLSLSSLGEAMTAAFPAYGELVAEGMGQAEDGHRFLEYVLVSDVFRWENLEDAMKAGDAAAIRSCFEFIEGLLGSSERRLVEVTQIRVVPYLLQDSVWEAATVLYAGARTAAALELYTEDQNWRHRGGSE